MEGCSGIGKKIGTIRRYKDGNIGRSSGSQGYLRMLYKSDKARIRMGEGAFRGGLQCQSMD